MHSAPGDRWTVRAASCRRQNCGRYKVKEPTAGDAGSDGRTAVGANAAGDDAPAAEGALRLMTWSPPRAPSARVNEHLEHSWAPLCSSTPARGQFSRPQKLS